MTKFDHLLVATDGSEGSKHAAEYAGNLARRLKARVTVIYVQDEESVPSHAWGLADGMKTIEQVRDSLEEHAMKHEISVAINAIGELQIAPVEIVAWGHPSEIICAFASENEVDLIVIGSHGRSGLKRAFLGSVSQAVANQAPCPVTIVR